MIEPDDVIYLDNNATTQLDPAVVEEMRPFLERYYGNPSSGYGFGRQVRDAIELARERVANLLGCRPNEIVFTSGGTEANNIGLLSGLQLNSARKHIVTTAVEHSAVREHCQHLAGAGFPVTFVSVDGNGDVDLDEIDRAIREDTALVTAMWANNETGVVFPVKAIAQIARRKQVLFHTDAVQAAGKLPINTAETGATSIAISAHKFHGPKGVGALYVSGRSPFRPTLFGGGQENGRRAGTENVAGIVGLGKAAELAAAHLRGSAEPVRTLRDTFERLLAERISDMVINGAAAERIGNTSSVSFVGIESDAALLLLDQRGVCCSAGSACRTGSRESSHVLRAMQLPEELLRGSVRFSFGRFNRDDDAPRAAGIVVEVVERLRRLGNFAAATL